MAQSESRPAPAATSSRALLARLIGGYVRPHARRLGLAVAMMVLAAATTALNAWLMQPALDDIFLKRDAQMLLLVPLAVLFSATLKGVAEYGRVVLMNTTGQRIVADLQKEMFAHLVAADMAFFHDTPSGTLVSRFTNDVHLLRSAVSSTLTGMVRELLSVVFLVGVMFYQSVTMSLIAFFAFPAAIYPIIRVGKRLRKVSTSNQVEAGNFVTLLSQVFQGARHVKAYGMEPYEKERANALIEKIRKLYVKGVRVGTIPRPVMEALGGMAVAAVIFYGGRQVIDGTTTPGTFFSFITALLLAYQPLKTMAGLNAQLQEGLAAAARVFALLDTRPTIRDATGAKTLEVGRGEIVFENVSFAYAPSGAPDVPALRHLSLRVPGGKTVALVGPSGAGKSTILNLIPRFYDVTQGAITLDGQDIRGVTLASLRRQIALVSQEVTLFDDTVRANIAYGRFDASASEILEAAKRAAAHEFIEKLPQGYDTLVGEQGIRLSGGQRQRIAIARAMLKNAPVLLLDEATSALDTESERQVQAALDALMQGRTTLVIAHRLSTVQHADIIHVIEDGRLAESGTHETLLARGALYARLYQMQFAAQAATMGTTPAGAARRA